MAENAPQQRQQSQPPVSKPYTPTPEEKAYLAACGVAIEKGCEFAASAEAASNADAYLKFANGVKALTDAYTAIKTGGRPSRHEGA